MRDWYGTPGATGVDLDIDAFSTVSNPGHREVEEYHAVFYIHDGDTIQGEAKIAVGMKALWLRTNYHGSVMIVSLTASW